MFRELDLPEGIPGKMLLHKMPGRDEPALEPTLNAMRELEINCIISLTGMDEILSKSLAYGKAIQNDGLPCPRVESSREAVIAVWLDLKMLVAEKSFYELPRR